MEILNNNNSNKREIININNDKNTNIKSGYQYYCMLGKYGWCFVKNKDGKAKYLPICEKIYGERGDKIKFDDLVYLFTLPKKMNDVKLNYGKNGFYLSLGDKKLSLTGNVKDSDINDKLIRQFINQKTLNTDKTNNVEYIVIGKDKKYEYGRLNGKYGWCLYKKDPVNIKYLTICEKIYGLGEKLTLNQVINLYKFQLRLLIKVN